MPFNVDPALPVPVGTQLRGVIEYGIVCGQLAPGLRLPTVRSMAKELGIAPMTVSQVYKELKAVGLLAISDQGEPSHNERLAERLAKLGMPCFGCVPDRLPDLLAAALKGADLRQFAEAARGK